LITGGTGVGKSVIAQDYIQKINPDKFVNASFNFSAQTTANNLLDLFISDKFIKKGRDLVGPPAGKKMIVFIDDINMPALE